MSSSREMLTSQRLGQANYVTANWFTPCLLLLVGTCLPSHAANVNNVNDGVSDQFRRGPWAHNLKKIRGCSVCTAKVVMATVLATEVIGESPLII